ncbi:MAG: glycosyltransferase, partial [Bacteroidota bacterium]
GPREVVEDGSTGFLIEPDHEQLTEKIELLMNDPQSLQQMGFNGRKLVEEKFTIDKAVESIRGVLEASYSE